MVQPTTRNTKITLEEEAMPGSVVEARQAAERAAVSKASKVPTAKELEAMPDKVRADVSNRVKAETLINIAMLSEGVDFEIKNAESNLAAIIAEAEATTAMAEAAAAEAEAYAAQGEADLAEANRLVIEGFESGLPTFEYSGIGDPFKEVINQDPKYTNAGIAAAIAALKAVGVEGLGDALTQIRDLYPDISSDDALLLLKFDKRFNAPYLDRFQGNKMLMDKGFAPLDDKVYLANEQAYSKIFTAYNLETFNNRSKYAEFIGNLVAPEEIGERVSNVYERVTKGPQDVTNAIKELFPELTTQDLMAYALDPKTQLPVLKRKIQAAEIGGAALAQGLGISSEQGPTKVLSPYTNVQREALGIDTLVSEGVSREQAVAGYSAVAGVLEGGEKLSAIYGKDYKQYGRLQAEQEAFLKSAEAKSTREKLVGREIAEFSGTAGRFASRDRAAGLI